MITRTVSLKITYSITPEGEFDLEEFGTDTDFIAEDQDHWTVEDDAILIKFLRQIEREIIQQNEDQGTDGELLDFQLKHN